MINPRDYTPPLGPVLIRLDGLAYWGYQTEGELVLISADCPLTTSPASIGIHKVESILANPSNNPKLMSLICETTK